jgi:hypothetical protein
MVANEVYRTPTITISSIVLSMSKTFLFHYLFNECPMELLKGDKLDQMLLNFVALCSPGIHNFIASLKHCPSNSIFIDYILRLKTLYGYDYI